MNNQLPSDEIISLEAAANEFITAFGMPIGKLILEKLTLIKENIRLKACITQLEQELNQVKSELFNKTPRDK